MYIRKIRHAGRVYMHSVQGMQVGPCCMHAYFCISKHVQQYSAVFSNSFDKSGNAGCMSSCQNIIVIPVPEKCFPEIFPYLIAPGTPIIFRAYSSSAHSGRFSFSVCGAAASNCMPPASRQPISFIILPDEQNRQQLFIRSITPAAPDFLLPSLWSRFAKACHCSDRNDHHLGLLWPC